MRDVLGQSWDILQPGVDWVSGGSHEGRPGTVLGHPASWGDLISTLSQEVPTSSDKLVGIIIFVFLKW